MGKSLPILRRGGSNGRASLPAQPLFHDVSVQMVLERLLALDEDHWDVVAKSRIEGGIPLNVDLDELKRHPLLDAQQDLLGLVAQGAVCFGVDLDNHAVQDL